MSNDEKLCIEKSSLAIFLQIIENFALFFLIYIYDAINEMFPKIFAIFNRNFYTKTSSEIKKIYALNVKVFENFTHFFLKLKMLNGNALSEHSYAIEQYRFKSEKFNVFTYKKYFEFNVDFEDNYCLMIDERIAGRWVQILDLSYVL